MLSRTFSDSGMCVVGGGLRVVIVDVIVALGFTAIARWF